MKILVQSAEKNISLSFPSGLIFNRGTVWIANTVGRKYAGDAMQDIPPEAMARLFTEFRRIKRTYGSWKLVEITSASGEKVLIEL